MSPTAGPSLRVEQALRLLPDVDALAPLRAFLISTSRLRASAEPYQTVGKRYVNSIDLKELVPQAIAQVTEHLASLYEAAVEALEAEERGDMAGTVRAFLRAGRREERVDRGNQARVWYDHALRIGEELRDRRPEIETLRHLGNLELSRGGYDTAGRYFQRSLALADAEEEKMSAAFACRGLGEVAAAQEKWSGARSWYTRGLEYAGNDGRLNADLSLGVGKVAQARGDQEAAAEWLGKARTAYQELNDGEGIVRALSAWGAFEASRDRSNEALSSYREALASLQRIGRNPALEMAIRISICRLYLEWERLPDAEDEIRRAEETAIEHNLTQSLARLYVIMGKVRGRQSDDAGFVFFEKAIELCRGRDPSPLLEAEAYLEYGVFRNAMGDPDEARAYLERSREILETGDGGALLARVDAELARLGPA